MAFISEIHMRGGGGASSGEFVEITLGPDDDPADFTVSVYDQNGDLHLTSGLATGEVVLSTLVGVPDPGNPDFTIYVLGIGLRNGNATANEGTGVALTNTADDDVIGYFSAARHGEITANEGAAQDAISDDMLDHRLTPVGESFQWDIDGNLTTGPITPADSVLCLVETSMVRTAKGPVAAGALQVGDLVWTVDHGMQPVRWIGMSHHTGLARPTQAKMRPVVIAVGALGAGSPAAPLTLSPQHRVLLRGAECRDVVGQSEVLVAAKKLTGFAGIGQGCGIGSVTYVHILFDRHEIIEADGAEVESLLLAEQSVALIGTGTLAADGPSTGLTAMRPARPIVERRQLKALLVRFTQSGGDLCAPQLSEDRA